MPNSLRARLKKCVHKGVLKEEDFKRIVILPPYASLDFKETLRASYEKAYKLGYDAAIKALEQEPKWIPVSERLPDTDDDALVTDGVDMFVAWYKWQEWRSSDNNFEINTPVDAWMPLPEPYKTESEGKE